jgi:hypothetical protein
MGKISNEVSKGLGAAIAEIKAKINGDIDSNESEVEVLLNSGAEAQKKRKRRTKAEIEAEKQTDNSLFESLNLEDNRPEWEKRSAYNHDEFCEWELAKAKLKGLPEPDFDFRNLYAKGSTIYYVSVLEPLGVKELKKLYLRTVYPRMLIGVEEKGFCQCIGYCGRDKVFLTLLEADAYYQSIEVVSKYDSEEPKSRCKKNYNTDEDVDNENSEYETNTDSEEVD